MAAASHARSVYRQLFRLTEFSSTATTTTRTAAAQKAASSPAPPPLSSKKTPQPSSLDLLRTAWRHAASLPEAEQDTALKNAESRLAYLKMALPRKARRGGKGGASVTLQQSERRVYDRNGNLVATSATQRSYTARNRDQTLAAHDINRHYALQERMNFGRRDQ
jgi:hypothetical protein